MFTLFGLSLISSNFRSGFSMNSKYPPRAFSHWSNELIKIALNSLSRRNLWIQFDYLTAFRFSRLLTSWKGSRKDQLIIPGDQIWRFHFVQSIELKSLDCIRIDVIKKFPRKIERHIHEDQNVIFKSFDNLAWRFSPNQWYNEKYEISYPVWHAGNYAFSRPASASQCYYFSFCPRISSRSHSFQADGQLDEINEKAVIKDSDKPEMGMERELVCRRRSRMWKKNTLWNANVFFKQ